MTLPEIYNLFRATSGIATDTRKIGQDAMFVAIKGERFDANTFASEALQKGAAYVVIDNPEYFIDERTIVVEDSLVALQQLAAYHRQQLAIPIVGLTGSNGKTTTKELINAVLSRKFKVVATIGNLNNHIGVPLTLLSFTPDTQIGIVEMGANHQKEIEFLCGIATPDVGYITNFGKAHLEGFGGVEGVIKGKSELYTYLKQNNKTAIVNADDAIQIEKSEGIDRFTFGTAANVDVAIGRVSANPFVAAWFDGIEVRSNLIGSYNANNISAAIAIGKYFNVADVDIKHAIEVYVPANNRSQLITRGAGEIILDAYNANPSSMAAATANFLALDKSDKVMILGDMFELGQESADEHAQLVASLKGKGVSAHFIGNDFFRNRIDDEQLHFYPDFESFISSDVVNTLSDKTLLIKGSRGMALERILDYLPV
ncbi:UDP-N-acetylmuramoyl-tripeptide--D-alanyl-D-alanine ligase [Flavobacterium selenitireducens]|uniref:UDP-N-acetylmuramoyl-tripeptide--D-alanyl-D- alanine ligase n=1 Tax=Flavobacterium selenitireducens TaxID=2722704 RepID=UPI00168BAB1B|nr:UDP-N-acetylmuramoyl-tripeptide--D-alanyl-D-alanine ligase [Flavobacterium selenitireducens]MBD3583650.1 UDP-N-acetylmuramoyl-tripeptide--D-alanyl-D-alanine ligase [Flavobacterium selenitireducens]